MGAAAGLEREARSRSDVRCSIAPDRGGASIIGGTAGIVVGVMAASTAGVTVTVESVAGGATLARPALSAVAQRPAAGQAALVPAPLMRLAQMCRTFQKSSVRRAAPAMPRCMPGASGPVPWGLSCRPLPGTARASLTRGQWKRGRPQTPRPLRDRPPALPGRTTVALYPRSARFSSRISPPWLRMVVRATARPRLAPSPGRRGRPHSPAGCRGRSATPRAGMPPASDRSRARQVRDRDPGGRRPHCRSTHRDRPSASLPPACPRGRTRGRRWHVLRKSFNMTGLAPFSRGRTNSG